jgi:hypothetical protein
VGERSAGQGNVAVDVAGKIGMTGPSDSRCHRPSLGFRVQAIVATQSVALLDEFEVDYVVVAEIERGESRFQRLDASALSQWLESYSLSQLREASVAITSPNCYRGLKPHHALRARTD